MRVVQEVTVAGTGYFKALSDGTVEVLFLDGVRAQMMWKSDTHTPAQVLFFIKIHRRQYPILDNESTHQTA